MAYAKEICYQRLRFYLLPGSKMIARQLLFIFAISGIAAISAANADDRFSFVALGDMPYLKAHQYDEPEKAYSAYRSLIGAINDAKPAFTIHIGDIKRGDVACFQKIFDEQFDHFARFEGALVYTPGDNEWSDCNKSKKGKRDWGPKKSLAYLRGKFFADATISLGQTPLALERQDPGLVENVRFEKNGIHIITTHVVGPDNNRNNEDEFRSRNQLNIDWINESFGKAEKQNAKGVVLALHADMFKKKSYEKNNPLENFVPKRGFKKFVEKFSQLAARFGRPVLLVYGDSHIFRKSRPFMERAPNVLGLEVYGHKNVHAVEVLVDPDDADVFEIRPLKNPASTE